MVSEICRLDPPKVVGFSTERASRCVHVRFTTVAPASLKAREGDGDPLHISPVDAPVRLRAITPSGWMMVGWGRTMSSMLGDDASCRALADGNARILRRSRCCLSTRALAEAERRALMWPSGPANWVSMSSS